MIVPKSARIDLNRPRKEVIHLTQNDNTRQAKVMLYVDGRAYDVTADTDGATVEMAVAYILPNGYGDQYTETELGEPAVVQDPAIKNLYTINIDGPCTDKVGVVDLLIKFTTEAGQILHSFPLTLNVKRRRGSDVDPDGGSPATSRYLRKDLQAPATEDMTQPVGVTPDGLLVTAPGEGGGGGSVTPASIVTATGQMTTTQKTNTRQNIGAAPSTNISKAALASEVQTSLEHADKSVRFDLTQGLTDAQKSTARSNIGAGTYSKPSGGVPKTDLASVVQTSLDKADTAYQKPSGGITIYDLAQDVQQSISRADTAYQKPSGGIPASDMAQAVQTALTAAGTAVQPSDLASYVPRGKQATKSVNDTVRVAIASDGTLYVPTYPEGGGGTPAAENTQLITMTYYDGDTHASDTAAQIYDTLQDGAVNLVLIDRAGRECYLVKPPESDSGATCIAKFATYDESNDETIIYTINASGVVSSVSVGGYYIKPSGGIPQTDLATALSNKINGALQTGNLDAKTSAMTQAVGYDSTTGKLYTAPGGGGGSYTPETVTMTMTVGATTTELSVALSFTDLSAKIAAGARLVSQMTVGYDTVGIEWHVNSANTTQQSISLYTIFEDATGENLLIAYLSETGTYEMSGVVESHPVGNAKNPTITPKTGASPSAFSLADNTVYECETLTALTITSAPASGLSIITFTSGATATTASFPATVLFCDDQPDVTNGVFAPSANYAYEINIRNRKALVSRWAVSA